MKEIPDPIAHAANLISAADGLMITAGAGMGVDSGLPDFRGDDGFWRTYPALAEAGIRFESIASPLQFKQNPILAWGFYGHRLDLYRNTVPHKGFAVLKALADKMPRGAFVVTSNVDGQFQKAGFPEHRLLEIHGSIHHLQCIEPCRQDIWSADDIDPFVDESTCFWHGDLPQCPYCGELARPNVLMFYDAEWLPKRTARQREHLEYWQSSLKTMVVLELGAGTALPTIRRFSLSRGCPVIRIDPRNATLPPDAGVGLAMGAQQALELIATKMGLET